MQHDKLRDLICPQGICWQAKGTANLRCEKLDDIFSNDSFQSVRFMVDQEPIRFGFASDERVEVLTVLPPETFKQHS